MTAEGPRRPFEIVHDDPRAQARVAAVASGRERDPATRERERSMTMQQRLRAGFELSRFASRLHTRARGE